MSSDARLQADDPRLLEVAAALADARPIDWRPGTAEEAEDGTSDLLRRLRILEELSDAFHQSATAADETVAARGERPTPLFAWGELQVLRSLGKGGFGEVYLAWDPALDRRVALKLHRPGAAASSPVGRFALDEARRLARVRHPNVLTVHGAAVHDGVAGLWSDFIEGQTLDRLLAERGPFGAAEVVAMGTDLCLALSALHAAGIVHGDVKASNVMREHGGRIVLMDLGAGRIVDGGRSDPICVTRAIAAPEVLRGSLPTPAADLYSLGALLFRLLTGSNPRETSGSLADLRPDVPVALGRVVERALGDDPAQRFPSAGAMGQALQHALGTRDAVEGGTRVPRKPARAWWLTVGVTALAVALAGLLAWAVDPFEWLGRLSQRPLRISSLRSIASSRSAVQQAAFSPDGSRVAYISDESGSPQVWILDLAGGSARRVTDSSVLVGRPTWTPDGRRILYTAWGTILSVSADGTAAGTVTQGWNASVAPRSGRLVFERTEEIWVGDPDGSNVRKVSGVPEREMRTSERLPAFSPDERYIAFVHAEDRPWGDLWLVPAEGGAARPLTSGAAVVGRPVWTPDGRAIVFSSRLSGQVMLWQIDARKALDEGPQRPRPLSHGEGDDTEPAISSDGRFLLFTATRNNYSIGLLDPATGRERTLRDSRAHILTPSLSGDGRRIAFFGWGRDGRMHVYTMDSDGQNVVQVTNSDEPGDSMHPVWSADGRELFFYRVAGRDRSWRRVPASGGASGEVQRGWTAPPQLMIRFDASGRRAVYTWFERDLARVTRILDLETGIDREFHHLLRYPSFLPDGSGILGMDGWPAIARSGPLLVCPSDPGPCRQLAPAATYAKASADGSTVYFQRPLTDYRTCQLWSVGIDGTDLRLRHTFVTESPYLPSFDIGASGEIVLQRLRPGQHELWLADLTR